MANKKIPTEKDVFKKLPPPEGKEQPVVATFQMPNAKPGTMSVGLSIRNYEGSVDAEDGVFSIQFNTNTWMITEIQEHGATLIEENPVKITAHAKNEGASTTGDQKFSASDKSENPKVDDIDAYENKPKGDDQETVSKKQGPPVGKTTKK